MPLANTVVRCIDEHNETDFETVSACPLCGEASFRVLPTPSRWISETFNVLTTRIGLVSCRVCKLEFTNPRPSNHFLAAFYSGDTYDCHNPSLTNAGAVQADVILRYVTKVLSPAAPKTLLDFGCGAGGFLMRSQQCGWDAQGFEPGRRGIETCRLSGLTVTSDLSVVPRDYFSLITLQHVFEHLPNPGEVLNELRPLLRADGRLLVQVPNVRSLRARFALPFLSARFPIDDRHRAFPIHLMYYSDRTLRGMVAKAGWSVETTFTLGLGLDEYFVSPEQPAADVAREYSVATRRSKSRLRHRLRDVFLDLGLGENLVLVARRE